MSKEKMMSRKFGMIAVRKGFADRDDVDKALELQERIPAEKRTPELIGKLMVRLGAITQEQREIIVAIQQGKEPPAPAPAPPKMTRVQEAIAAKTAAKKAKEAAAKEAAAKEEKEEEKEEEAKEKPSGAMNKVKAAIAAKVAAKKEKEAKAAEEEAARPPGYRLTLSFNKLEAFITPEGPGATATLDDIKKMLEEKGVTYGVVNDELISERLADELAEIKAWRIAAGVFPRVGQDWEIVYHFDAGLVEEPETGESEAGEAKAGEAEAGESGAGEAEAGVKEKKKTLVKKGDLIAEKIQGEGGTPGTDVFGEPVSPQSVDDFPLRSGEGVSLSGDGRKATALIDGRPELSEEGKILVIPYLRVSGDVGSEQGDQEFKGHIEIEGAVKEGVGIKGRSLKAAQISDAKIDVTGNVVIRRGIIDSNVMAMGSVTGRHVFKSSIKARGDIVIENEIVDSDLETNGVCLVEQGKIRHSKVGAKKGITAREIGSDASKPCTIKVGIDFYLHKKIEGINQRIAEKEERREKLVALGEELEERSEALDIEIDEKAQEEGPITAQQVNLQKKIDDAREAVEPEQRAIIEDTIQQLGETIRQINETVENLFEEQELTGEKQEENEQDIERIDGEIDELRVEIDRVNELSEINKGTPEIKVLGTIYTNTVVQGAHEEITLDESRGHIRIEEYKIGGGPKPRYGMRISEIE